MKFHLDYCMISVGDTDMKTTTVLLNELASIGFRMRERLAVSTYGHHPMLAERSPRHLEDAHRTDVSLGYAPTAMVFLTADAEGKTQYAVHPPAYLQADAAGRVVDEFNKWRGNRELEMTHYVIEPYALLPVSFSDFEAANHYLDLICKWSNMDDLADLRTYASTDGLFIHIPNDVVRDMDRTDVDEINALRRWLREHFTSKEFIRLNGDVRLKVMDSKSAMTVVREITKARRSATKRT